MQPHKLEPKRQQRAEFLAEGVGNKKTKTRETTEPESAHVQSAIPSHFHVRIAFNPEDRVKCHCKKRKRLAGQPCLTPLAIRNCPRSAPANSVCDGCCRCEYFAGSGR